MAKTGRLGQYGPSCFKTAWFCLRRATSVRAVLSCRHATPGGRRPAGAAVRSRDTRAVAARVAVVRASVGGSDEVPLDSSNEHGDATLYRLGCSCRCRGGSACESYPRRGHTVDSPAAVREEDDEELPPDIEFSLGGQHFEMSIERFAVHLGIYYEPETVRDDFTKGLPQGGGVMRAWWAQISDTPFTAAS
ncbi:hypothetical protein E3N88_20552 [Mikania micrantha]|uniref:Uncharacterized protein n=1 Tax=Mikania micrantha TaxID=192012 RepID=A0A5N6NIH9_9ASTR|nr:hypothetical protein E3N88_20552 [Mikania micrantha]